jgi:hypothetical protein
MGQHGVSKLLFIYLFISFYMGQNCVSKLLFIYLFIFFYMGQHGVSKLLFIYLFPSIWGNIVSVNGVTEEDVTSRIKEANGVFVQLYPVWRNHNI